MAKTFTAESITEDLKVGKTCNIPGVGKLKVVERKAREGRNPQTGEPIQIAARKSVKFSPSSTIVAVLNGAAK